MRTILEKVFLEGRNFLSELESYQFFKTLGLDVPHHELIPDSVWLRGRLGSIAKEYPSRVVLKIASPDIHHKTEIGGVAIVENKPDVISGAFDAITTRARAAMPKARIDGVLLMEFVEIEHELLVSLLDDPTFGHVLSVGKGGTLTEIFKDIAMRPAPMAREKIEEMLKSLKTYPTLKGYRGAKGMDLTKAAEAISKIATLARVDGRSPLGRFEIAELEINPFVITPSGRVLPIDSILRFREAREIPLIYLSPIATSIHELFHPKSIAVVGASDAVDKMGGSILKSLIDSRATKVFPVNPKRDELMGLKAYHSVCNIPEPVDLAVLAVPANQTLAVIKECAKMKARTAIIISGGFGETGEEGKKVEAQMLEAARNAGMRLVGPNCMGVYFEPTKFSTFFLSPEKTEIPRREVNNFTVLSQSGAISVQLVELIRNVGIRAIVSYGNMIDISVSDLMAYFNEDEGTDVIGLYIEGLPNGQRFLNAARRTTKPTLILKGGKSHAGSAATVSHTGAIAGDYDIASAMFEAAGLVEARTLEEFADFAKAFAFLKGRVPAGRRVAVISNAGGLGVLAADATEGTCLQMAAYESATVESIGGETRDYMHISNPTDLGPGVSDEGFVKAAAHVLDDANVDSLVVIPGIQPRAMNAEAVVDGIIKLYARYQKPMVVSITPTENRRGLIDRLESARIAHYDTPERAVKALAAYVGYHTTRQGK
jgi:acyl-CoA synthetase (NDP forming)